MKEIIEDLRRNYKPSYHAESVLGLKPDDWQREILDSSSKQIIVNCSRQVGKSTTVGAKSAHQALMDDSLVVITSPSERQSVELLLKVKSFIISAGEELTRETQKSLEFKNGSRIFALPGSEKTVRGFSAVDLLIIDEASRTEDELYYSVEPMLAVSQGQTIILSTPFGMRGFFYEIWENGGPEWERISITAYECPRIPANWLEQKRDSTPDWVFRQEFLGEFMAAEDAVFSIEDIYNAVDDKISAIEPEEDSMIDRSAKTWEEMMQDGKSEKSC